MIGSSGVDLSTFRVIPHGLELDDLCRILERVAAKPTGCWEWGGRLNDHSYGALTIRGKTYRIHRILLEASGEEFGKLFACHHCDNPPCCRPDHLFAGTAKDNALDCASKGRMPSGDAHWSKQRPEDIKTGTDRWWTNSESLPCGDAHWSHQQPERVTRGEQHGMSKLTDAHVSEIRRRKASGERQRAIASAFNVSPMTVSLIVNRKIWRHLP